MKKLLENTSLALFIFLCLPSFAQLIVNNPNLPVGDYQDYNSVEATPITSAAPGTGQSIHLYIDKAIPQPISGDNGGNNYTNGTNPTSNDLTASINTSDAVGKIPYSYNVSSTGAATYNVPIQLPPGTADLAPTLSINYHSQAGEGVLGIGWNLSGLTSITRMGKTIYHNGYVGPINMDNTDWFALDGNRLVPTSSDLNGQDGTQYSTEDEIFVRVTSHGTYGNGPDWFTVETKSGLTIELGHSNDSKLVPENQGTPTVMSWLVSKISDAYGNYITFQYNNQNGEILAREIDYTANDAAGISPVNVITFTYGTKTNTNSAYTGSGAQVNSTALLTSINITNNGALYKKYSFKYNFYNVDSYLTEMDEEGADGSNLNPLLFSYLPDLSSNLIEGYPRYNFIGGPSDITSPVPFSFLRKYILLDYNGDGKTDLLKLQGSYQLDNPPAFYANQQWLTGKRLTYNSWTAKCYQNTTTPTGASFTSNPNFTMPSGWDPSNDFASYSLPLNASSPGDLGAETMDFNGDGKEDLATTNDIPVVATVNDEGSGEESHISIYLSNGAGFSNNANTLVAYQSFLDDINYEYDPIFYLDLNGDRQMDVFNYHVDRFYGTEHFRIWYNAGTQSTPLDISVTEPTGFDTTSPYDRRYTYLDFSKAFPMDIDGDGSQALVNVTQNFYNGTGYTVKKVIVKFDGSHINDPTVNGTTNTPGTPGHGIMILPDNSGFTYHMNNFGVSVNVYNNSPYAISLVSNPYVLYGDFNGDGISDILYAYNSSYQWKLYLGIGGGNYAAPIAIGNIPLSASESPWNYPNTFYYTCDVNGDGKTDIIEFCNGCNPNTTTIKVFYSTGTSFIEGYESGLGNIVDPERYQISFGDFNGDGNNDLFMLDEFTGAISNAPIIIYFEQGALSKYMNEAVDGYGVKTKFYYQPLSSDDNNPVYSQPQAANYRSYNNNATLVDINTPLYAVSRLTVPDGTGGTDVDVNDGEDTNSTSYSYEDAIFNLEGKGFLGFLNVTSQNNVTGYSSSSDNTFDPTFFNTTGVTTTISNSTIAKTISSSQDVPLGVTGFPFQRYFNKNIGSLTANYITNGFNSTYYSSYDAYGNVLDMLTNNTAQTTDVQNTYTQSGAWLPSKVATTITTNTRTGEPPYARETDYTYSNGSLLTEKKDPGTPKELDVANTYDANTGALTQQITNSMDPEGLPTVAYSYQYDPTFTFVTKTTNPQGQTSETTYDPKWAKPLSQTSIDGLTTYYTYDGYGRQTSVTTPDGLNAYTDYNWVSAGDNNLIGNPFSTPAPIYTILTTKDGAPDVTTYYDMYNRVNLTVKGGFIFGHIIPFEDQYFTEKYYTRRGNDSLVTDSYDKPFLNNPVVTTNTYDALDRLTQSSSSDGTTTLNTSLNYSYTNGSATVTTTMPDGRKSSKTTDMAGLVTQSKDNNNTTVYTKYLSNNQMGSTALGSVSNIILSATYDQYGRRTGLTEVNSGTTAYEYNGYGQLYTQQDANGNKYTFAYDNLGRITSKVGPEGTYTYNYVASGNGLDMLKSVVAPNGITKSYTYDNLRRTTQVTDNGLTTSYAYDAFNNISKVTYPSGFSILNNYTSNGYLTQTTDASNNNIWSAGFLSPLGHYTNYTLGSSYNPITCSRKYDNFNMPQEFKATGANTIQDLVLNVNDENGDLLSRKDNAQFSPPSESFTYPNNADVDHLTEAKVTTLPTGPRNPVDISYDAANDNITNKTDIGSYTYAPANSLPQQNQVVQVDNNQSLISSNTQNITYTPFKQPSKITDGTYELDFTYGPDQQREEMDFYNSATLVYKRYYNGSYEKTVDAAGNTTEVHYINCGGNLVAMCVIQNHGTPQIYYTFTDHLGSILKVTDYTGNLIAQQNFDAWGNYRNPTDWSYTSIPTTPDWLYRGFTGHEMLPQFDLINMNGRMYDPLISRFLGVDNFVQNPFAKSYNRYSYALNNPLKYTDPNGEKIQWTRHWWFGNHSLWNYWTNPNASPNSISWIGQGSFLGDVIARFPRDIIANAITGLEYPGIAVWDYIYRPIAIGLSDAVLFTYYNLLPAVAYTAAIYFGAPWAGIYFALAGGAAFGAATNASIINNPHAGTLFGGPIFNFPNFTKTNKNIWNSLYITFPSFNPIY